MKCTRIEMWCLLQQTPMITMKNCTRHSLWIPNYFNIERIILAWPGYAQVIPHYKLNLCKKSVLVFVDFFLVKYDNLWMRLSWKISPSYILIVLLSQVCIFWLKFVQMCCLIILGQKIAVYRLDTSLHQTSICMWYSE